ncbi:amidohydrolase family protein [uncultured Devosia sp.]|uniref:amidohydrolase family protein n=1 Tax=uncultured Devosia sp. TaxID=211434 RepID=UPI0035CC2450
MIADATAPLCLPPVPMAQPPSSPLPDGTVDTHFHVFKAGAPLNTTRSYTPQIVTLTDWRHYAKASGIARGVLVQPSVYGFDNAVLLEALASDPQNLRAIAVLPAETSLDALRRLDELGVRGVRINTRNKGGLPFDAIADFAGNLAALGWTLQFQIQPEQLSTISSIAPSLGVPVVIDHLGFIALGTDATDGHVADLQRLLDGGRGYVKLSAPYRLTTGTDHRAFGQIVRRLVASHPERLLWGSDWPHTELWENMPDDAELINEMQNWLGNDPVRRQVFASTAQSLFFSR